MFFTDVFAADTVVNEKLFTDFENNVNTAGYISPSSEMEIVRRNPINGNRSLSIKNCRMSWNGLSMTDYVMAVEFKLRFDDKFNGKLDLGVGTDGTGDSFKNIISVIGTDNEVTAADNSGKNISELSYNTVYKIAAEIKRGSDEVTLFINDTELETTLKLTGLVFGVESVTFNVDASDEESSIMLDDIRFYTHGKTYPQKYSAQAPGTYDFPELPNEPESAITFYINSKRIYFQSPLIAEDNTVYVPAQRLFESVDMAYSRSGSDFTVINDSLNLAFTLGSNIATINGTSISLTYPPKTIDSVVYIPLNLINEALNARVWYDNSAELIVVTTGSAKTDNVLTNIEGRLYMNGQPYYELSFLYDDLFRNIWKSYREDPENVKSSQAYNTAASVLTHMHNEGFKSIRTFLWQDDSFNVLQSTAERERYFAALDIVLELCDINEIRVVPCLGLNSKMFLSSEYVDGYGWAQGDENVTDLTSDPESRSRKEMLTFLDELVRRYVNRDTILMWELCDGANIAADCGATNNTVTYSLIQLSDFYSECAAHIRAVDNTRLISGGDGLLLPAQYHLLMSTLGGNSEDWTFDDTTQKVQAINLLTKDLDVVSFHGYNVGVSTNAQSYYTDSNGSKVPLTFQIIKDEAAVLGKPLVNGATYGAINYGTSDGGSSDTQLDDQVKYIDSIVDAGIQLSYWQTDANVTINNDFFVRNNLSSKVSSANAALSQRHFINRAATENTNMAWDDSSRDVFDPENIIPGENSTISTGYLLAGLRIAGAAGAMVLIMIVVTLWMNKKEKRYRRSSR